MRNYYVNEEQVKKALQINSFRELSKDKIMEFVSLIPHMDKEVAMSVINQFPAYTDSAKVMVEKMGDMCNIILADNSDSRNAVVSAYTQIFSALKERLSNPNISSEERNEITQDMILVADKIAYKDTENKQFLAGLFKYGAIVIGGIVIVGASILGVNIKAGKIPTLAKA